MSEQALVEVVVDRKRWYRGKSGAKLQDENGMRCCLGFACLALGVPEDAIAGACYPTSERVRHYPNIAPTFLNKCNLNTPTLDAICTNDDCNLRDDERERRIAKHGRELGLNFTFIN